ncbi:hypothetical protein GA0115240_17142 [Streptomyces sp. DvalAA-14]|nr:hypothetical protein GA0115240_17142 [Streptomyces sp. DvalAA-14]
MAKQPDTDPITSKYQDTPWEPEIDKSAKDASDEQKAADKYTSIYGGTPTYGTPGDAAAPGDLQTTPTLATAYTVAPDLEPTYNDHTAASTGDSTAAPQASPFTVDLGALRTAEQAFLDATKAASDAYATLRTVVMNAVNSDSLFGQDVGSTEAVITGNYAGGGGTNTPEFVLDPLDDESTAFAAQINPQMEAKLVDAGNVIELMGTFTALLNNAGQTYTETDSISVFPTPTFFPGGHGPVVHPGGPPTGSIPPRPGPITLR